MAITFRSASPAHRPRHQPWPTHGAAPFAALAAWSTVLLARALRHCVLPTASTTIMADQLKGRLAETRRRCAEARSLDRSDRTR